MKQQAAAVRKNQIIPLEITGMTAEGNGVGHFCGLAVFVPQTAVGDRLDARVVKVQKSYAYGIIEKLHTPSPERIAVDCADFRKCGGCVFRHIRYEAECRIKQQIVSDAFQRLGHITPRQILPILGAESPDRYRNKAQYPCGADPETGRLRFGLFAARSHRLIPVAECVLQPRVFGEIVRFCEAALADSKVITPYDEESGTGVMRHLYLRRGYHSGEIMVCFVTAACTGAAESALRALGTALMRAFPDIRSVMLNVNPKRTNVILGEETRCLCGSETVGDTLCGIPLRLSPQSFYQVNTAQAERLYAEAKRLGDPKPDELLLDLYCGAGAIGLSMADAAGKVLGVEVVPQAVENARENAERAGIGNAEFFCGDAGEIAAKFAAEGRRPDLIVLDPPRKGCDAVTLDACVQMAPQRIVMISCNPATAARDAAYLCGRGYTADTLRAVDMFPRTAHTECVVLLTNRAIES